MDLPHATNLIAEFTEIVTKARVMGETTKAERKRLQEISDEIIQDTPQSGRVFKEIADEVSIAE